MVDRGNGLEDSGIEQPRCQPHHNQPAHTPERRERWGRKCQKNQRAASQDAAQDQDERDSPARQ